VQERGRERERERGRGEREKDRKKWRLFLSKIKIEGLLKQMTSVN
jgi:hypothetical protein